MEPYITRGNIYKYDTAKSFSIELRDHMETMKSIEEVKKFLDEHIEDMDKLLDIVNRSKFFREFSELKRQIHNPCPGYQNPKTIQKRLNSEEICRQPLCDGLSRL